MTRAHGLRSAGHRGTPSSAHPVPRSTRGARTAVALVTLLLVTATVRSVHLARRSLWLDEGFSVWNATGARPELLRGPAAAFRHRDWEAPNAGLRGVLASVAETE